MGRGPNLCSIWLPFLVFDKQTTVENVLKLFALLTCYAIQFSYYPMPNTCPTLCVFIARCRSTPTSPLPVIIFLLSAMDCLLASKRYAPEPLLEQDQRFSTCPFLSGVVPFQTCRSFWDRSLSIGCWLKEPPSPEGFGSLGMAHS